MFDREITSLVLPSAGLFTATETSADTLNVPTDIGRVLRVVSNGLVILESP